MKTNKLFWIGLLLIASMSQAAAQQVSTLYFLENAPMRHTINPAFQPVSDGYLNFTPLGYTSFWVGNNSLTISDAIKNVDGKTVTALYPGLSRQELMNQIKAQTSLDGDMTLDLLSFGFRTKKNKGYVHFGIVERIEFGVGLPKDIFSFVLDGGMKDLQTISSVNKLSLRGTTVLATAYTEVSGGYSHKINDKWTVGGKLKFLVGQAKASVYFDNMDLFASAQQWRLFGQGQILAAAPVNLSKLPEQLTYDNLKNFNYKSLTEGQSVTDLIKPQGYGAGIDLGFTFKPHPRLQLTAAVTDLGFVVWKGVGYQLATDTTFNGVDGLKYADYAVPGKQLSIDGNKLSTDILKSLEGLVRGLHSTERVEQFTRMLSAKVNAGIDANFADNKLGIGVVSKTRFYDGQIATELTFGGALRPCNWFNLAVSYSLLNNAKYSSVGGGLSFMPYDGINFTLAMDYIPTSYVKYNGIPIPYEGKGVNVALGFSIVWRTNHKAEQKVEQLMLETQAIVENIPTPVPTIVDKQDFSVQLTKLNPERKFDTDGDGLYDFEDECPHQAGPRDNKGCPTVQKEVRNLLQKAMQGIQFETGKDVIKKSSHAMLDMIAQVFIENPSYIIEVQGHTDNTGKVEKNMDLSQRRANAVMNYLIKNGVPADRMTAIGYGPTKPIASNDTKDGRAINRRVEFVISFEEITYEEVYDRAN